MKKVTFTLQRLHAMPRSRAYLDELAACAVERTKMQMTFDADGECYQRLKVKYAGYRPTGEDIRRARGQAQAAGVSRREALIRRHRAGKVAGAKRRGRGCGGCGGRNVRR